MLMNFRIALGTDHGGFADKNALLATLKAQGHRVIDCGTFVESSSDYPIFAGRVSELVSTKAVDFGIILCRSGIGMSMVANRYSGVRAALVTSPETAKLCRNHNDANVFVFGSDHNRFSCADLVQIFLKSEFEGGRHARRVDLMGNLDVMADATDPVSHGLRLGQSTWLVGSLAGIDALKISPTGIHGVVLTVHASSPGVFANSGAIADRLQLVRAATGNRSGVLSLPLGATKSTASTIVESAKKIVSSWMEFLVVLQVNLQEWDVHAVEELVAEGLSLHVQDVNRSEFKSLTDARLRGLERRLASGHTVCDQLFYLEQSQAETLSDNGECFKFAELVKQSNYDESMDELNAVGVAPMICCFQSSENVIPSIPQSVRFLRT